MLVQQVETINIESIPEVIVSWQVQTSSGNISSSRIQVPVAVEATADSFDIHIRRDREDDTTYMVEIQEQFADLLRILPEHLGLLQVIFCDKARPRTLQQLFLERDIPELLFEDWMTQSHSRSSLLDTSSIVSESLISETSLSNGGVNITARDEEVGTREETMSLSSTTPSMTSQTASTTPLLARNRSTSTLASQRTLSVFDTLRSHTSRGIDASTGSSRASSSVATERPPMTGRRAVRGLRTRSSASQEHLPRHNERPPVAPAAPEDTPEIRDVQVAAEELVCGVQISMHLRLISYVHVGFRCVDLINDINPNDL
jgi:hypothetical protein